MLKRITKVVTVAVTIVCLVAVMLPASALAVDPMSATMMANAFAQAVAAYGASQGAAMTFDVSSTNGIGEGVHELWEQFRADSNESDDFDSVASAFVATNPYGPQSVNIAGQTLRVVGVNIDETIKPVLDDFWNWLLTGPAEMVKVDNEYYQFSDAQIGDSAVPIFVYNNGYFGTQSIPGISSSLSWEDSYDLGWTSAISSTTEWRYAYANGYSNTYIYCFAYPWTYNTTRYQVIWVGDASFRGYTMSKSGNSVSGTGFNSNNVDSVNSHTYHWSNSTLPEVNSLFVPVFEDRQSGLAALDAYLYGSGTGDAIGVKSYDNTGVAEFPDSTDENYDAIHPPIPLNIPWDDALYGDGTGTLTDAQTEAIASDAVDALESVGVVELVEEAVAPTPNPGEVYIPLLPVTLPSFNFNLSGIWHYVREWVSSLGSFFSTLFSIWSTLPYAMVVPVYATAVVVIVLGVYKRFFM